MLPFQTAEQRWATGDTVIAHGNHHYRVVSVIPVEWLSEFVDEPRAGARGRAALAPADPAPTPDRLKPYLERWSAYGSHC
jgi:hypothetical protein